MLSCGNTLYSSYKLKRVYYSAFSPIPDASAALSLQPANMLREHRLYQADWLMRFYEFDVQEIVAGGEAGMLDSLPDPKLAWTLKHREQFPVDINRAERSRLLRIPGLGMRGVDRILTCRSSGFLRLADLQKISRSVKRMLPFIVARDWSPATLLDSELLRGQFVQKHAQLDLFGS